MILGPTFSEMRDPRLVAPELRSRLSDADELDPIRLFDIRWVQDDGSVRAWIVPKELTGTDATIAVLLGDHFPTGAHKVGPAYSCLIEQALEGDLDPSKHTLVFPSTGNYGIGGAWVGPRMGYKSLVVLPEEMSAERFEKIRGYGADIIATPGCESNVKEIYDEVKRLKERPEIRVLNQFEAWGNYRFHRGVTGPAAQLLAEQLGFSHVSAFVSAMGSAGTIAAGDHLKTKGRCAIVGVEPVQCPTLYNVGYGGHRIEGIGDKHVTWIHNVHNMDLLCCVDDDTCVRLLQLLQEGDDVLREVCGLDDEQLAAFQGHLGVSGICNLIGAIKSARALKLGSKDLVVTVATDGFDRYPSVLRALEEREGPQTRDVAMRRLGAMRSIGADWLMEGTIATRERWHNQKYFTWVEQQGKTVEELDQLRDPEFWDSQVDKIPTIDARILEERAQLA